MLLISFPESCWSGFEEVSASDDLMYSHSVRVLSCVHRLHHEARIKILILNWESLTLRSGRPNQSQEPQNEPPNSVKLCLSKSNKCSISYQLNWSLHYYYLYYHSSIVVNLNVETSYLSLAVAYWRRVVGLPSTILNITVFASWATRRLIRI